jgi:signal transduction histidine kinase
MEDRASIPVEEKRRRPKVLYVDDQAGNLVVFKASLQKYADIKTTTSTDEALKILAQEEYPIVISDQRMEPMNGAYFLSEVRKLRPDTMRILMTAYTDFDDAVAAINEGQVMRFVTKPWDPHDLATVLINATELYWTTKENRYLSEQLLHKERLAAIGQVTSGVVHELGNIANVLSVAQEIREEWKSGADLTQELEILQRGIDHLMLLVESLRIYSKGGDNLEVEKQPVDLNSLVATALMLARLFPQAKRLKSLEFTPKPPLVAPVDSKKVEQVILNLVKNAAEACPEGKGVVLVSLDERDGKAVISIRDNGPGIPPSVARQVWEGFFTTKGNQGTGLGLHMCKRIIEAHGGSITFSNNVEGGCVFTLTFPTG